MRSTLWHVMIADVVSSRLIPQEKRAAADRLVTQAIQRTVRRYLPHFRLRPQVLRGDEIQAVLRPTAPALSVLTYLRAQLAAGDPAPRVRAGLGTGAIARLSPKGPFASEGEAFHRARSAIEGLKAARGERLTGWDTGEERFDDWARAMLPLLDALMGRWTQAQWEAVAGRLETRGLHDIARLRGVSFQSVSKVLRIASWSEVQAAMARLEEEAAKLVQGRSALKSAGR